MQDEFVDEIRGILSHLYDYPYLQRHALADRLDPASKASDQERMRILRATVLGSIEEMNPGTDVPLRSPRARSYNVLNLHYVEGLTISEVSLELAISERQAYRDLRQAERDLAALLWARIATLDSGDQRGAKRGSRLELALREAERLHGDYLTLDVEMLVQSAIVAVERLAQQHPVELVVRMSPDLGVLRSDRQLVRQAFLSVLSHAVQHSRPHSKITILCDPQEDGICLRIGFEAEHQDTDLFPSIAKQFIHRLEGQCSGAIDKSGQVNLELLLRSQRQFTVLVIDDNEGLIELFQRYLSGEPYRVVGARDGREGLRQVEEEMPDAIILDVMMPHQDGWEVLQQLVARQSTCRVPVIVCSVLHEPELAQSLGATDSLTKPVTRTQLLEALSRCRRCTQSG